ncbi:MAG: TlpA disulfide reductase family protein [Pseudomonadota bacterium]|nr:TlpA disulfide reductase family protein [Pseudomonadota bacterium]
MFGTHQASSLNYLWAGKIFSRFLAKKNCNFFKSIEILTPSNWSELVDFKGLTTYKITMKKNPTFLKKFISVLKNVVLMAVVVYAVTAFQQRNLLSTDKTPAPYFNLATLKDPTERMTIAQLQGKQTVVYFFAPWCSICRYSMPNLEKAHQQGKLNAIAIALDYQNIAEVKQFTDSLELTMPVLLGSKSTGQDYKISAYPTYYVINEQLAITAHSMGYSTELGLRMRTLD